MAEKFPITSITFNRRTKCLILGDEFGNIEIWDLSKLLDKLHAIDEEEKRKKKLLQQQQQKEELYLTQIEDKKMSSSKDLVKKSILSSQTQIQLTQDDEIPFFEDDIQKVCNLQGAHKVNNFYIYNYHYL